MLWCLHFWNAGLQAIFKRLSQTPHSSQDPRVAIESGPCTFYYLISGNTCFLTLTEKGYPKKLAFQYLEELAREFNQLYGSQVDGVTRPYAFIKFGEHSSTSSTRHFQDCRVAGEVGSKAARQDPYQPPGPQGAGCMIPAVGESGMWPCSIQYLSPSH